MRILNKENILQLTEYGELTDAITVALKKAEEGEISMPPRMHIDFGKNTVLLMPCSDGEHFATKLVSTFPDNPKQGLPVIYGSVILNEGTSGKPLALLEGSVLTGLRTGAVGSIGIKYTTPENTETIGLIGAGVQGYYQLKFACIVRPIKSVFIFDRNTSAVKALIKKLSLDFPEIRFSIAQTVEQLLKSSKIIITATTSATPVLPNKPGLLLGKHYIAVGSYTPKMQELPGKLFCLADQIIVDTEHATHESGDVINPVKANSIRADQVIPILKLITDKTKLSSNSTTIFKTVGMALFDLAAAKYFYEKAVKNKIGTEIDL